MYNQAIMGLIYLAKILGLLNLGNQKENIISNLCTMTNLLQVKIPKEIKEQHKILAILKNIDD